MPFPDIDVRVHSSLFIARGHHTKLARASWSQGGTKQKAGASYLIAEGAQHKAGTSYLVAGGHHTKLSYFWSRRGHDTKLARAICGGTTQGWHELFGRRGCGNRLKEPRSDSADKKTLDPPLPFFELLEFIHPLFIVSVGYDRQNRNNGVVPVTNF